ncbi:MAG TPA: L,D-transpeptidase [Candidatus Saccharimonadales bacterium]|nr:L,D-transpeptidase [Candidatus Saccharimonadales bacterium]
MKPRRSYSYKKPRSSRKYIKRLTLLFVIVAVGLTGYFVIHKAPQTNAKSTTQAAFSAINSGSTQPNKNSSTTKTSSTTSTNCSPNTLSQLILVSISKRELWACDGSSQVYSSKVITGMEFLPADLTPVGTYHIYAKVTDTYLKGCDTTGCWNDHVNYFMEFLDNQYGVYGLHDATWRSPSDFGNISPDSSDASHGCVEMPLATATWLYNWSQVGTTVTIEA